MNSKHYLSGVLVLASASVLAVAAQQGGTPAASPAKTPAAPRQAVQPQDEGERAFRQHCSRCHTAPQGFPPSISGTIVRHMRVRAGLSQHDEEALLHFFNP
jgi:mono/diheme cytochrome c family protein